MADNQESGKKDEKSGCGCGKSGCSGGCGGGCCGAKALLVLVLVLLGGIIGYLMGSHGGCGWHHHGLACPYTMMGTPPQAPSK